MISKGPGVALTLGHMIAPAQTAGIPEVTHRVGNDMTNQ